jgi:hypothetical protein
MEMARRRASKFNARPKSSTTSVSSLFIFSIFSRWTSPSVASSSPPSQATETPTFDIVVQTPRDRLHQFELSWNKIYVSSHTISAVTPFAQKTCAATDSKGQAASGRICFVPTSAKPSVVSSVIAGVRDPLLRARCALEDCEAVCSDLVCCVKMNSLSWMNEESAHVSRSVEPIVLPNKASFVRYHTAAVASDLPFSPQPQPLRHLRHSRSLRLPSFPPRLLSPSLSRPFCSFTPSLQRPRRLPVYNVHDLIRLPIHPQTIPFRLASHILSTSRSTYYFSYLCRLPN